MKIFLTSAALILGGTIAHAATINVAGQASTKVGDNPQIFDELLENTDQLPLASNNSKEFHVAHTDDFGPGSGSASASYAIDQSTGVIKFGAAADVTAPTSQVASRSRASVSVRISELFSIQGTGDITFRLGIDGIMGSTALDGGTGVNMEARMRLVDQQGSFGFQTIGSDSLFIAPPRGTTAVIDDILEFTTSITKSQDYLFLFNFSTVASTQAKGLGNSGSSTSNFMNTAYLSYTADSTLTVTASDPLFLSNTATPNTPAVPLPAGAWLLLTGLALLPMAKRR